MDAYNACVRMVMTTLGGTRNEREVATRDDKRFKAAKGRKDSIKANPTWNS